jgi:hypothetical protein
MLDWKYNIGSEASSSERRLRYNEQVSSLTIPYYFKIIIKIHQHILFLVVDMYWLTCVFPPFSHQSQDI